MGRNLISISVTVQCTVPIKVSTSGVPVMAQLLTNPTNINEDTGLIPGFAQRVQDLALL